MYKIISNEGEVVGLFSPLSVDTAQIGSLKITNPKAMTVEGIPEGSTFGDIKNAFQGHEIFSDWITQLAAVYYKNFYFNLDFPLKNRLR